MTYSSRILRWIFSSTRDECQIMLNVYKTHRLSIVVCIHGFILNKDLTQLKMYDYTNFTVVQHSCVCLLHGTVWVWAVENSICTSSWCEPEADKEFITLDTKSRRSNYCGQKLCLVKNIIKQPLWRTWSTEITFRFYAFFFHGCLEPKWQCGIPTLYQRE